MAFFDPTRPSYLADPYPALARLRSEAPVYHWREFASWVVTSYEHCSEVLQDHETFRTDPVQAQGPEDIRQEERRRREAILGGVTRLVSTDPPDHTRRRGVVSRAFAYRALEERRPAIEAAMHSLLDGIVPGEPFDFIEAIARPVPLLAIAEQLGVAPEDRDTVVEGARAVLAGTNPLAPQGAFERGREAASALAAHLDRLVEGHAPPRGGEVLARMVVATREGELTREELLTLTIDLTTAGNRAVEMALGSGVRALLERPDALSMLREDPGLIPGAVEELLRFETPAQALPWFTSRETVLGGQHIAAGEKVFVMPGAANRDPAAFADPDRLDLRRAPRRHVAFGAGIHACLGASLARLELDVALSALLGRFAEVRLAERRPAFDSDFMLRGPSRLMVVAG